MGVSRTLSEMSTVLGVLVYSNATWHNMRLAPWSDAFLLSAIGGPAGCTWRFSPDLTNVTNPDPLRFVAQQGTTLRITVGDVIVSLPHTRVFAMTGRVPASQNGLWLVQQCRCNISR